jgi:hypothetical protein
MEHFRFGFRVQGLGNHLVAAFRAPVEHFRMPRVIDHLEMLVRAGG